MLVALRTVENVIQYITKILEIKRYLIEEDLCSICIYLPIKSKYVRTLIEDNIRYRFDFPIGIYLGIEYLSWYQGWFRHYRLVK